MRLFGVVDANTFVGGLVAVIGVIVEFALVGGCEVGFANSAFGACAVGGPVVSVAVRAGEFVGRSGCPGSGGAGAAYVVGWWVAGVRVLTRWGVVSVWLWFAV